MIIQDHKQLTGDQETKQFAEFIFSLLQQYQADQPVLLLLSGELGAGKTTFTKYLGELLGVEDIIVSPTFTISREYPLPTKQMLYHIDAYRMENDEEMQVFNDKTMFSAGNVIVIEWPQQIQSVVDEWRKHAYTIDITFEHDTLETRKVSYSYEQD